jgi:hypothetical protein
MLKLTLFTTIRLGFTLFANQVTASTALYTTTVSRGVGHCVLSFVAAAFSSMVKVVRERGVLKFKSNDLDKQALKYAAF